MYHHFAGKEELAAAAVERTAQQMRAEVEPILTGPGMALGRISAYLYRERDVLRGCRMGGLTQDPGVFADERLRAPVEAIFSWLTRCIAEVLADGVSHGELPADLEAAKTAATIVATLQGGYVLARAANDAAPFSAAIDGILALLTARSRPDPAGQTG